MHPSSDKSAATLLSIPSMRSMLRIATLAAALGASMLAARSAGAQTVSIHAEASDSASWVVDRLPLHASGITLQTRDRNVALLLMDTTLVVQLTDRGLDEMQRGAHDAKNESVGGRILARMVIAGLSEMFDHGIAYRLSALGSARADGSRLVLEDRRGHRVFEKMELNGHDVMDDFPSGSAQWFAAKINEAIRRQR